MEEEREKEKEAAVENEGGCEANVSVHHLLNSRSAPPPAPKVFVFRFQSVGQRIKPTADG